MTGLDVLGSRITFIQMVLRCSAVARCRSRWLICVVMVLLTSPAGAHHKVTPCCEYCQKHKQDLSTLLIIYECYIRYLEMFVSSEN